MPAQSAYTRITASNSMEGNKTTTATTALLWFCSSSSKQAAVSESQRVPFLGNSRGASDSRDLLFLGEYAFLRPRSNRLNASESPGLFPRQKYGRIRPKTHQTPISSGVTPLFRGGVCVSALLSTKGGGGWGLCSSFRLGFAPFRTPEIGLGRGAHRIIVRFSGLIACKLREIYF